MSDIINSEKYDNIIKNINKISTIDSKYNISVINKMKNHFSDENKQLFLFNFYMYINYNQYNDFVVDGDKFWQLLDFKTKGDFKRSLINKCIENEDYIIQKIDKTTIKGEGGSGILKETILLTVNGFKKFCLSIQTTKAKEIHEYYLKLEEIINEVITEEAHDLKQLLSQKDSDIKELQNKLYEHESDIKELQYQLSENENNIISVLGDEDAVYGGIIENGNLKVGKSHGNTADRVKAHKYTYGSFTLKFAIPSHDEDKLEDLIEQSTKNINSPLYNRRYEQIYKNKNRTELYKLDKKFNVDQFKAEVIKLNELCKKDTLTKLNIKIEELTKKYEECNKERILLRNIVYDQRTEIHNLKLELGLEDNFPNNKIKQELIKQINKEKNNTIDQENLTDIKQENIIQEPKLFPCSYTSHCKTLEEFGINPDTNTIYSQCIVCRGILSDRRFEESIESREKSEKEYFDKKQKINDHRQKLLESITKVKCFRCLYEKLPIEMGINNRDNCLYKTCIVCRDNTKNVKREDGREDIEGFDECGKCHYYFIDPSIINKQANTVYKTCTICRKDDVERRKKSKEEAKNLEGTIKCKSCKKECPKVLSAKKDAILQKCESCLIIDRENDKKKYYIHHEEILEQKKEYYEENKSEIRDKQKIYYNENRDKILLQKQNKKLEQIFIED